MLEIGNLVRIVELKARNPKSWIFSLKADEEKSTHLGQISHNDLMGKNFGDVVHLSHGIVAILNPSPKDFLKAFKLKTQILYADDCAIACGTAGIGNGMMVGEAGTGSGALTTYLAWSTSPHGHVYTFDINEIHLENAKRNIELTGLKNVTFSLKDIRENIEVPPLDAFFLDFSDPFDAIDSVTQALTGGGHLVCFVPNWGQVEQTVNAIDMNPNLTLQETFEITRRNFAVNPKKHIMRPSFRSIVYTGILIHAIKINPDPFEVLE
jgi:tRNA (adenine57-N1/adenine58-N1)-methyltransferase